MRRCASVGLLDGCLRAVWRVLVLVNMRLVSPQRCSPAVPYCAGLPSKVRPRSWQPCALCILGDLRVRATARCIHIQLRVAVLRNSPSICFGVRGCGPDRGRTLEGKPARNTRLYGRAFADPRRGTAQMQAQEGMGVRLSTGASETGCLKDAARAWRQCPT